MRRSEDIRRTQRRVEKIALESYQRGLRIITATIHKLEKERDEFVYRQQRREKRLR
jgi:hypothetical protein